MQNLILLLLLFLITPANSVAQTNVPKSSIKIIKPLSSPSFALPVRCTYGDECWIMNTPDIGSENDGKSTDSNCLSRTYDGHKGTDFAIRDKEAMDKGIDVLAAADGVVLRVRDGEPDRFATNDEMEKIKADKKECGNGVFIDHGGDEKDKWQSIYCHMKQNSIIVKPNQNIKKGDKIGQVGLSGMTEFPHLHIGITHNGKTIDPLTGQDITQECGIKTSQKSLWSKDSDIKYEPLKIGGSGFSALPPSMEQINLSAREKQSLAYDSANLVLYATFWGVRQNDVITLTIKDIKGEVFAQNTITQDKNRARQLYYIGRKSPKESTFDKGTYTGTIEVKRVREDKERQVFKETKSIVLK